MLGQSDCWNRRKCALCCTEVQAQLPVWTPCLPSAPSVPKVADSTILKELYSKEGCTMQVGCLLRRV